MTMTVFIQASGSSEKKARIRVFDRGEPEQQAATGPDSRPAAQAGPGPGDATRDTAAQAGEATRDTAGPFASSRSSDRELSSHELASGEQTGVTLHSGNYCQIEEIDVEKPTI